MDYVLLPRGLVVAKLIDVEITEHKADSQPTLESFEEILPFYLRWTSRYGIDDLDKAHETIAKV